MRKKSDMQNKGVKTLEKIRELLRISSFNEMAGRLGIGREQYQYAEERGKTVATKLLCKVRWISGLSWEAMGKMLDDEFLSPEERRKLDKKKAGK